MVFKKKKDRLIILGTEEFLGFISIWKLVQYFVTFIWLHTVKDTKYFQGMQTQHLWQEAFITRKNQVNRISPNFLRNIQYLRKQGLGLSGNLEEEVFEKTKTCIRIGWKRNETDIHGNYQNEIIRTTAFILTLISLKTSTKFVLIYYDCLKSDPNLPKKIIICFNDSPSKWWKMLFISS